jgi:hypothetical protein
MGTWTLTIDPRGERARFHGEARRRPAFFALLLAARTPRTS